MAANAFSLLLVGEGHPLQRRPSWWGWRPWARAEITPSHILLGLVEGPRGVGYHALVSCGVDPLRLRDDIIRRSAQSSRLSFRAGLKLPLSRRSHRVVEAAIEEAWSLGHDWVGTEHLLLAICQDSSDRTVRISLRSSRVTAAEVRKFVVANVEGITRDADSAHVCSTPVRNSRIVPIRRRPQRRDQYLPRPVRLDDAVHPAAGGGLSEQRGAAPAKELEMTSVLNCMCLRYPRSLPQGSSGAAASTWRLLEQILHRFHETARELAFRARVLGQTVGAAPDSGSYHVRPLQAETCSGGLRVQADGRVCRPERGDQRPAGLPAGLVCPAETPQDAGSQFANSAGLIGRARDDQQCRRIVDSRRFVRLELSALVAREEMPSPPDPACELLARNSVSIDPLEKLRRSDDRRRPPPGLGSAREVRLGRSQHGLDLTAGTELCQTLDRRGLMAEARIGKQLTAER